MQTHHLNENAVPGMRPGAALFMSSKREPEDKPNDTPQNEPLHQDMPRLPSRSAWPRKARWNMRRLLALAPANRPHIEGPTASTVTVMTRVRGYAEYKPQNRNRELVENVQAVLAGMSDYLPLTLRQVFYRLVVKEQIEKTENGYARLCEVCNRARRAGMIRFNHIRDDGPRIETGHDFVTADDLTHYLTDFREDARMDLQSFQEYRIYVWCEAAGMVPQLTRVAHKYGVTVLSSGGFDSLTMKHDMAEQFDDDCIVLHLGDHDPSGVHIFKSLAEDIRAFKNPFSSDDGVFGMLGDLVCGVGFVRLAVTPEQRDDMGLPTAPPKATDNRSFDDDETVQCEAISPPDLAEILENAILEYTDIEQYEAALDWQQQIREAA